MCFPIKLKFCKCLEDADIVEYSKVKEELSSIKKQKLSIEETINKIPYFEIFINSIFIPCGEMEVKTLKKKLKKEYSINSYYFLQLFLILVKRKFNVDIDTNNNLKISFVCIDTFHPGAQKIILKSILYLLYYLQDIDLLKPSYPSPFQIFSCKF